MPSGNGTIGAGVYGGVHEETVLLTHEDLWHRSRTEPLPDVSDKLTEVREALRIGQPEMYLDEVLSDDDGRTLGDALADYHQNREFARCSTMGELTSLQIRTMLGLRRKM